MKTIILAAGYATRLYPLTEHKPKALLNIGDKPLLDYIIAKIIDLYEECPEAKSNSSAQTEIILISNHRFIQQFQEYAQKVEQQYPDYTIKCIDDFTDCPQNRLGALRDLLLAFDTFSSAEDCLVLASDNYFDFSLVPAYKKFCEHRVPLILTQERPDFSEEILGQYALVKKDEANYVTRIEEKPKEIFSQEVAFATYFYPASVLPKLATMLATEHKSDSPGQFPVYLHNQGENIYAYQFEGVCLDIGTKEVYRKIKHGI